MSVFNPEDFQSPQNITVPIESRTEIIIANFAFSPPIANPLTFRINTGSLFGKIVAKFKIVNESNTSMTYQIPSLSATLRTVPPNTSTTVEEYTYFISINFDPTNTTSYIELDLIKPSDGKQRSSPVGEGAA